MIAGAVFAAGLAEPALAQQGCGKPKQGLGSVFGNALDLAGTKVLGREGAKTMRQLGINSRTFLSSTIFCALSSAEAKQASDAKMKALESGKTGKASAQNWSSGERGGVTGGTTVVSRNKSGDQDCAVTSTFVTDENGDEKIVEQEQCMVDGKWQLA